MKVKTIIQFLYLQIISIHLTRWIICMLLLFFSIVIHYFYNRSFYNISLDIDKCPFCYGNDICSIFENMEVSFSNLTFSESITNLINIKNVYIANYNNTKVIIKRLGHDWELNNIDNIICKDQNFQGCPPYPDCYDKDFTLNIIEFLMKNKETAINLKMCSLSTINNILDSLFSLYTNVNTSVMTANIWTTFLANAEPLILQLLAKNNWPVPFYYGACGRIIMEEYCGRALHSVENEPWIVRANLALQLLQAADDFTNKHPIFRFYLTDISSDNIVVTDDYQVKFIDLENVIINEKTNFQDYRPHESENFECENCYAFSSDEICAHRISDHNYYSVCKLLLSKSAPWPMMENGLLRSPPDNVTKNYPEIFNYIEICAGSSETMNRFEASKNLIKILKILINNF